MCIRDRATTGFYFLHEEITAPRVGLWPHIDGVDAVVVTSRRSQCGLVVIRLPIRDDEEPHVSRGHIGDFGELQRAGQVGARPEEWGYPARHEYGARAEGNHGDLSRQCLLQRGKLFEGNVIAALAAATIAGIHRAGDIDDHDGIAADECFGQ